MSSRKAILLKLCVAWTLFLLTGCASKPDFSKIKKGMKTSDVLSLVGAPYRKQPMSTAEWWLYNDHDHHLVIFDNDTVSNCLTQDEATKIMTDVLKAFDSTNKK